MGSDTTVARGRYGETLAIAHLKRQGYRILRRNYACRGGEIDIIAEENGVLCFVEVRSRRDARFGHPFETVNHTKQKRLIIAARCYLAGLARRKSVPTSRFDVVSIIYQPKREIQLLRNAFDANSY